jgi:TrmH family RNA methyltransferase
MIDWCRQRNIMTVCSAVDATTSYTEIDWTGPSALILGPESTGLTPEELQLADRRVSIPMKGMAESLNVAVASGILLFESARQRATDNTE